MSAYSSRAPLLEVQQLKKHFPIHRGFFGRPAGYVYAVDGVSLQLPAGKTLGLVGESGCGKSTLGRTILRLYEPSAGKILFNGVDICALSSAEMRSMRRQMQIIFQDPYGSLNPRMTIEQILSEPYIIHKICKRSELSRRVDSLLDKVGLSPTVKSRYPHEFSGGQKQRIGIARAIALEPKLIIADEPVSALDVSIQSQILNLLKDLQAELKLSYLFISHALAVVEHISDFVAVMYLGRIVEQTSREQLYGNPLHPYTRALIAAIPIPEVVDRSRPRPPRQVLKGDVPNPAHPPKGCHFHPRCPLATEICREKSPELSPRPGAGSHLVACHNV
jgi:oligopeptide transport system ATP-binding protein